MKTEKFGKNVNIVWHDRKRWAGMPLSFTRYYLVEKPNEWVKLFSSVGLFSSVDEELYLFRVFDISVHQSFIQKIFNEGTITLHVNDESSNEVVLTRVLSPFKVKAMIADYVDAERKRVDVQVAEFKK